MYISVGGQAGGGHARQEQEPKPETGTGTGTRLLVLDNVLRVMMRWSTLSISVKGGACPETFFTFSKEMKRRQKRRHKKET